MKDNDSTTSSGPPPGMPFSKPGSSFGIRAFMQMSPEQRVARFAGFLGGRRVLQRVNKVLEQQWLSAKTGYE